MTKYTPTMIITILAEHGTSTIAPTISPEILHTRDITTEANIMLLNRRKYISAAIIGSESIDMSNITPTRRIVSTMHTATSTVMV